MGEWWQAVLQAVREKCLPLQHMAPFLGSGLILAAGFCSSPPLRFLCLSAGIVLLLFVAADFARSLLDRETGNASYQGAPRHIPVTPAQVFLALIVAAVYFFMILTGLYTVFFRSYEFFSSVPVLLVLLPGTLVFSSLAAWRNVRLWYREGTDYEQALKEEESQSNKLPVPPVQ